MSTPTTRPHLASKYTVSPEMFLAVGDGVTDDRDVLNTAVTWLSNIGGGKLELTPGKVYKVDSALTIPATVVLAGQGILRPADMITITINGSIEAGHYRIFDDSLCVTSGGIAITQGPVNICWWGAVADNSTDCAAAIQSAGDTGRDVYIPGHGTRFRIYSTVTFDTFEQRIYGDSPNKSIINCTVGSNNGIVIDNNKIHVRDLKFLNAISGYAHIKINAGKDMTTIRDCVLQDAEYLIQDEGNVTCIQNCELEDYGTYGIYQPDGIGGGQLSVENCYFHHSSPSSGQAHARIFSLMSSFRRCTFGDCYDCIVLSHYRASTKDYQDLSLIDCWCEEAERYEVECLSGTNPGKIINILGGRWHCNFHSLADCHWFLAGVRSPTEATESGVINDVEGSTWTFLNCQSIFAGDHIVFDDGGGDKIFIGKTDAGFDTKAISGTENSLSSVYDFSVDGGAVGDIALGEIPKGCRVTGGSYEVLTALTSGGSATVSFGVATDDATGLLAVTPYNHEDFDTGESHHFIPDGEPNTYTAVTTAVTREVIMSIGTAALTAGKIRINLKYRKVS